jgi:hypothetical protein
MHHDSAAYKSCISEDAAARRARARAEEPAPPQLVAPEQAEPASLSVPQPKRKPRPHDEPH